MIWINGTFGGGKTTAGLALVEGIPALRLFDPEVVGYMLAHSLKDQAFTDFQDLPAWRALVPATALEIRRHIAAYTAAREWMVTDADLVIDTSRLTAQDVVARITKLVLSLSYVG